MKLVSPESLPDAQKETLREYSRFFPQGAVCVNVGLGEASWDIRPLVLINGKVHIVRVSTRIDEAQARAIVSDFEGFSVLVAGSQRAQVMEGAGRFLVVRPYFAETLNDQLTRGAIPTHHDLESIVAELIELVVTLKHRHLTHGHLSPSNIAVVDGKIVVFDPFFGALHDVRDGYLAPESVRGAMPEPSSDLFSLGRLISSLIGDSLTPQQSALVAQLTLPSPRQRPSIEEVASAFGVEVPWGTPAAPPMQAPTSVRTGGGKVVRGTVGQPTTQQTPMQAAVESKSPERKPARSGLKGWLIGVAACVLGILVVRSQYPAVYNSIARFIPGAVSQHSVEYDTAWASHERSRMLVVARAAIINKDPAAINAITSDILGGSNPEGVMSRLLRVALDDSWRDDLSDTDVRAAVIVALVQLFPEGIKALPPLHTLHPAVILAIASETQPKNANAELKSIPLDVVSSLPEPFGSLFSKLKELGVTSLGSPQGIGLAAIATGDTRPQAFEGLLTPIGNDKPAELNFKTRGLINLVLPIVANNPAAAKELLAAIRDQGSELANLAGWFEIEDLASWSKVPAIEKIKLVLGIFPQQELDPSKYADLLTYPVPAIRDQAAAKLKKGLMPAGSADKLLVTLASNVNGLTREQTISLVAALQTDSKMQVPFIAQWFALKPDPDTVVLILVARSNTDSSDIFNLEAARYLRRAEWKAPVELLKLLAVHPEPLARVLAYGKLDPNDPAQREILKKRLSIEKDEGCVKALMAKLSVVASGDGKS